MPVATPLFHRLPGRRHCPAAACTGRHLEAHRAGPRAGQGQHRHPQRTPAIRCPDPHRSAAQGRHRAARGHRLLARRRADQRPARGKQLPELQAPAKCSCWAARCLQPAVVRWHPLLSTLGGVYGLEQIPAGFVDRIEVVKGGGSALYGPGAVAGVINLIRPLPAAAAMCSRRGCPEGHTAEECRRAPGPGGEDADAGLSVIAQRNWNSGIDYNGDGYTEITRKNLKVGGLQAWYAPAGRAAAPGPAGDR